MKYLVVVDAQNDFITGALANKEADAAVPKIAELIQSKEFEMVYLTHDTHYSDYMNTLEGQKLPVAHCIEYTPGWQYDERLVESLTGVNYTVVKKNTFGSDVLASMLLHNVDADDEIYICGFCTDICVVSNALLIRAALPNNPIIVIADACAGVTPEKHEAALSVMESCQIDIVR